MPSEYSALVDFSNEEQSDLYVDPKNPKVNRNIVHSKLFAADLILRDIVEPVSKDNIEEFYDQKAEIVYCKIKGKDITAEEQKAVLKYQKLKNRVELRDIVEYGEIINELLGQLINWSFMRERDLLYFQLGFHYNCLRNNSEKKEAYQKIEVNGDSIKDAILYQIIGMYVNGVAVYAPDEKGDILKEQCTKGGAGGKISAFNRYSEYLGLDKLTLYNAGLEIFEVVAEHDDIINLRNGIDHFKYYLGDYRSMLSIYSEVFDRFFTYDFKNFKSFIRKFLTIGLSSLLAVGISAVILLPSFGGLQDTSISSETLPAMEFYGNYVDSFKNIMVAVHPVGIDFDSNRANLFMTTFVLLMGITYFTTGSVKVGHKIRNGILLAIMLFSLYF